MIIPFAILPVRPPQPAPRPKIKQMDNTIKPNTVKKEEVTISIDADLLSVVDQFVVLTNRKGTTRSTVTEQALHPWKQQMRDQFDQDYYSKNSKALAVDNESWSRITTASTKVVWTDL